MLNQLVVVGRLVKDPELRKTDNGRNVTNITLAVPLLLWQFQEVLKM